MTDTAIATRRYFSLKFCPLSWTASASTSKLAPDMVGYYVYTTHRVQDMFQNAILNEYVMWETLFTCLSTKGRIPPPTKYIGTNVT